MEPSIKLGTETKQAIRASKNHRKVKESKPEQEEEEDAVTPQQKAALLVPRTIQQTNIATTKKKKPIQNPLPPKKTPPPQASFSKTKSKPRPNNIRQEQPSTKKWWSKLRDVDPITLFPLSRLKEPPFEIKVENSEVSHFFDGKSLAVYLLSTGTFIDPTNRQEITRDDCLRLDAHLKQNGMKEKAKCTEMFDLQSAVRLTGESQQQLEQSQINLRREAGVIAASLFHYPTARDRFQPNNRITTNNNEGVIRVTDEDDDENWNNSLFPTQVEDDFPEMPIVRRRTRPDDFPSLTRSSVDPSSSRIPPPNLSSWAAAAASTISTGSYTLPTTAVSYEGPPPQWKKNEALSWRNKESSEEERPRLNLLKPTGLNNKRNEPEKRSESIFGRAKPVDMNLINVKTTEENNDIHTLCPFPPKLLQQAKSFGLVWVSSIEKKFKECIDGGTSRNCLHLDPMPETRRRFLSELGTKYWGLHMVEMDPEPKRFLQVSITASSFTPDIMISKALILFPSLVNEEYFGGSPTTNGILFHGCNLNMSNAKIHSFMQTLQIRESEYDLMYLDGYRSDERNVFLDFSSNERARKLFKKIRMTIHLPFPCRRVEWWPSGVEWLRHQIRQLNKIRISADINKQQKKQLEKAVVVDNEQEENEVMESEEDDESSSDSSSSSSSSSDDENDSSSREE